MQELEHKAEKQKEKKESRKEETVEIQGQYDSVVQENQRLADLVARLQF